MEEPHTGEVKELSRMTASPQPINRELVRAHGAAGVQILEENPARGRNT